ncbi:MAG: ral secretion pathway protein GspN [Rhizobacter sp.]|nr:ral secretion pathway protein GspN [Rhizobacter sp.]
MTARGWRLRSASVKAAPGRFSNTASAHGWGESTFAEAAWQKSRSAGRRWAIAGALVGLLIGVVAFAPAAWLARSVANATGERVVLSDARGTVWSGSAVAVLTGGAGSRDSSALPGRLEWTLGWQGAGLALRLRQDCCINQTATLGIRPALGRVAVTLVPSGAWVGQWPAAWLSGLGTPFNTLQLGGSVRLASPGFTLQWVQGRLLFAGRADIELTGLSSRLSTLDHLGSYRLTVTSDAANTGSTALNFLTTEGPLQITGTGTWSTGGVRFRGQAEAGGDSQSALDNLLNIIGRRNGARSVISIG